MESISTNGLCTHQFDDLLANMDLSELQFVLEFKVQLQMDLAVLSFLNHLIAPKFELTNMCGLLPWLRFSHEFFYAFKFGS